MIAIVSLVEQRGLIDHRDALEVAVEIEARSRQGAEPLGKRGLPRGGGLQDEPPDEARLRQVADDERGREAPGIGEGRLGFLVLGLAVNDDRVPLAAEHPRGFPDLFHQHAGGVVLGDGDALAHKLLLVLIGRPKGGDDHDVIAGECVPQQRLGGAGLRQPAADGEGPALVGLQEPQAAPEEILVHKRVVNQLAEHEDAASRIFRQRLISALDGVFHAEAEAKMARDDVPHRAEIEHRGMRRGAFMNAVDCLDGLAEAALVKGPGHGILGVDAVIALLLHAKTVDVLVFAEMQVGNPDQVGLQPVDHGGERRGEVGPACGDRLQREKAHLGIRRRPVDLGEKCPVTRAAGRDREILRRRAYRERGFSSSPSSIPPYCSLPWESRWLRVSCSARFRPSRPPAQASRKTCRKKPAPWGEAGGA